MCLRLLNISFEALTQTLKTDMALTLKMNYLNISKGYCVQFNRYGALQGNGVMRPRLLPVSCVLCHFSFLDTLIFFNVFPMLTSVSS